jgi:ComF family protein
LPFQSFEDQSEHLCGTCILAAPPYSGARSFGHYTAELARLVQGLKFNGRRNLLGLLAPLLAVTFFENWNRDDFDIVVPVPLHSRRKRQRGYNQAELLARSLTREIAIPYLCPLRRIRPTLPQVGLSDLQREENVRKAFVCTKSADVSGKRILLIDDVMTTGATVSSAAQSLIDGGALRVSVLTIARVGR